VRKARRSGSLAPKEEIIVPTETPGTEAATAQHGRAAPAVPAGQAPRRLGLALAVIATAELRSCST